MPAGTSVRSGLGWPSTWPTLDDLETGCYESDGDYLGPALHRCARLMATAHGGQIILSERAATVVAADPEAEVELRDLGRHRLRDLADREHVFQLLHPELWRDFPPLRSLDAYPGNLPKQATSFIGRRRELAELADAGGTVAARHPGGGRRCRQDPARRPHRGSAHPAVRARRLAGRSGPDLRSRDRARRGRVDPADPRAEGRGHQRHHLQPPGRSLAPAGGGQLRARDRGGVRADRGDVRGRAGSSVPGDES